MSGAWSFKTQTQIVEDYSVMGRTIYPRQLGAGRGERDAGTGPGSRVRGSAGRSRARHEEGTKGWACSPAVGSERTTGDLGSKEQEEMSLTRGNTCQKST